MNAIILFFVLILGALTRLYHNTAVALWHDEAFSALYIRDYGWGEMLRRIILDVHPPLYYFLLRLYAYVFGDGLLSLRFFSVLFGVLTIYAGYLFVKKAFSSKNAGLEEKGTKLALFAALLIALNPFQIQYAVEARMYTLGTFLVLFTSFLLLKALEENSFKTWLYFGLFTTATAYTHYFLFFSIAAQGLYVIYYSIRQHGWLFVKASEFIKAMGAYLLAFVLYLPWLPSFLEQIRRVEQSYWIPQPDGWSVPSTIWKMLFGGEGINRSTLILAFLVTLLIVFYFIKKVKEREKWLVILSLFIPFFLALGLSFKTALYLDRYFVFASLFFTILIAVTIGNITRATPRRFFMALLVLALAVAFFKNWAILDIKNKPGMAEAGLFINEQAAANDKIYVGSSFVFFTFRYYNQTGIKPLLVSASTLETIPHFSGTALLNNEDLVLENDILNNLTAAKNDSVWLVWTTGFGSSKPNVPGNWSIVSEHEFPDSPGFKGSIFVTRYHVK